MTVSVTIENIGGIRSGEATLVQGLNVVRGANWQGKTSFVHGLEAALGIPVAVTEGTVSGSVTVEGDAVSGTVEVVDRQDRTVVEGTPLLRDDAEQTKAQLYACLGERNLVREAVRAGENLESVLTRPLDLENIDRRIGELKAERDRIDTEISKAENSKQKIPQVKERIETLQDQIDTYESRLAEMDGESESVSEQREELSRARSQRNQRQSEIERLERSIERYEGKITEKRAELDDLTVAETTVEYADIEAKKAELDEIRSDIKVLESLFTANNLLLEENGLELLTAVEHGMERDTFSCWICGAETSRSAVADHIDTLRQTLQARRSDLDDRKRELSELETEYERARQQEQREQVLEEDIQELERERQSKQERLAARKEELADLEETIESLRAAVDESVEEITDVESDLKFRRSELEEAQEELEQYQRSAYQLDQLEKQREEIRSALAELRDRKTSIKQSMRETFHETMQEIVRTFETGFESARLTANFDLVVARDGREADLDALSEGELEVLGFIAALAGYEAFDVEASVPFLLLDGLEALSDENLHHLVEYFEDRAAYLVVTAHPEHTDFSGNQIDPAEWDTVTPRAAERAD